MSVCPSVCLSHRSTAAVACAGLAAERLAARRNRSLAGASIQRQRGQRHVDSRRRRLNTDLLWLCAGGTCPRWMQSDGVVAVAISHVINDAVYFAMLNIISALTCAWCFDAVRNWVVGCWRGYLSGARCRLEVQAQLMPLQLAVSCLSEMQIGFTFLVPAHSGSPGQKGPLNGCVCVGAEYSSSSLSSSSSYFHSFINCAVNKTIYTNGWTDRTRHSQTRTDCVSRKIRHTA